MLLGALKYDEYGWEVIGDFKMVSFLMGLQGGFTKYPCFICLWDSRDTKAHYHRRDWPQRTEFTVGKNNVKWEPLVDPRKVLMPPQHIKLGLIKQFVRALDKESRAFNYLQDLFPKLSEAKIKAGVFVGPQIKKIIECSEFPKKLNRKERAAWNSFVTVVRGFLGNHKDENYVQLVQTLIKNYAAMGCRMSLKIHILDAHLDKFKENMGAYSEEQGERFHQDIMNFECRYQGQYNENMMGDYIWGLIRESDLQYSLASEPYIFDESDTAVEEDILLELMEANPDLCLTVRDSESDEDQSASSSLTDTLSPSSDNDLFSRHSRDRPVHNFRDGNPPTTVFSEAEAAKEMVENALVMKPGGQDVLEVYKSEKSLNHRTRRQLVSILASHMTEMHGRIPSRKQKEK
ncbi:hypothetical protein SRHO_G00286450 [Serrasalmus rhombeus]